MAHKFGIVGATGAVGLKMKQVLSERVKDVAGLRLFASAKSEGKMLEFSGQKIRVENLAKSSFKGLDVVFFSAGSEVSKNYCPKAVSQGAVVIDNSNAFRMNEDTPLIVPEVNFNALKNHKGLISNPNCSTIQMVIAIAPIHKVNPIKRVVVSTYQSVSGTGLKAVDMLMRQCRAILDKTEVPVGIYPYQIAFNLIPQIDIPLNNGLYREEEKMVRETAKILDSDIKVCPTAVRVPVYGGHSESINLELTKPFEISEIKSLLSKAEEVVLIDDHFNSKYPMPLMCEDKDDVFIGRIRRDESIANGLNMWVVADNLRRGAATNAVKIYARMAENGFI